MKNGADNELAGFNTALFAYGMSGSGKSHTILGTAEDEGLIPRVSKELFERVHASGGSTMAHVEVSFLEIYNEKVRDLLNFSAAGDSKALRVRNHPKTGPYVEGLTRLAVASHEQVLSVMQEGAKSRSVASTNMNETSSRSHAIFTLLFTQTRDNGPTLVSRIDLVDLAGSERANKTGAQGQRLREGASINQSLSTLGKVIYVLADSATAATAAAATASDKKRSVTRRQTISATSASSAAYIPYRDSTLTWLLKDSLGGNAKTIMLATISPNTVHQEETVSTLRYAERAKSIQNRAVVNEDPNAKAVRELQEEVERLRSLMKTATQSKRAEEELKAKAEQVEELREQLLQSESMVAQLKLSWEDKLRATKELMDKQAQARKQMGIAVKVDKSLPCLINLNEDRMMSEVLMYYLRPGETLVGNSAGAAEDGHIALCGVGIAAQHCRFHNDQGRVAIEPLAQGGAFLNGRRVEERTTLCHGDRVVLGAHHVFRFNDPEGGAHAGGHAGDAIDWNFALRELAIKQRLIPEELEERLTPVKKMQQQEEVEKTVAEAIVQVEKERGDLVRDKDRIVSSYQSQHGVDRIGAEAMFRAKEAELAQLLEEHKDKFARARERRFRKNNSDAMQEEKVLRAVMLVQDANTRCHELGKELRFELKMRPLPQGSSELVVQAVDDRTNKTAVFSVDGFAERVAVMHEACASARCDSPSSPSSSKNALLALPDPFALDMDQEVTLGKSFLYLKPLMRLEPIVYSAPISDTMCGERRGELQLELRPSAATVERLRSLDEKSVSDAIAGGVFEIDVRVLSVSGLSSDFGTVRCVFSMWDSETFSTKSVAESRDSSGIIALDCEETLVFQCAGQDFVAFLRESFVSFEVLVGNLPRSLRESEAATPSLHRPIDFSMQVDLQQEVAGEWLSAHGKRRHWNDAPALLKLSPEGAVRFRMGLLDVAPESCRLEQWVRAEISVVNKKGVVSPLAGELTGEGIIATVMLNRHALLSQVTPRGGEVQLQLSMWLCMTPLAEPVCVQHSLAVRIAVRKAHWNGLPPRVLRVSIKPGQAAQAAVSNLIEYHRDAAFALDTLLKAERIRQELAMQSAADDASSSAAGQVAASTPVTRKVGKAATARDDERRRHSVLHLNMLEQSLQKTKERKSIAPTPSSALAGSLSLVSAMDVSVKEIRSTACDYQGWMKMSKTGGAIWKKLYFVLRRPILSYWNRKEDFATLGLAEHGSFELFNAAVDVTAREGRPFSFSLAVAEKTVWLQASDAASLQRWVQVLSGSGTKSVASTPLAAAPKSPSIFRNLALELEGAENCNTANVSQVAQLHLQLTQLQAETKQVREKDAVEGASMMAQLNAREEELLALREQLALERRENSEMQRAAAETAAIRGNLEEQLRIKSLEAKDLAQELEKQTAVAASELASLAAKCAESCALADVARQELQRAARALEETQHSHKSELSALAAMHEQDALVAKQKNGEELTLLREQLQRTEASHEEELKMMKESCCRQIETLTSQMELDGQQSVEEARALEERLEQLEVNHKAELDQAEQKYESEMSELIAKCEKKSSKDIAAARAQLETQAVEASKLLEYLKQTQRDEILRAEQSHRVEVVSLTAKFQEDMQALEKKWMDEVSRLQEALLSQKVAASVELDDSVAAVMTKCQADVREVEEKCRAEMEASSLRLEQQENRHESELELLVESHRTAVSLLVSKCEQDVNAILKKSEQEAAETQQQLERQKQEAEGRLQMAKECHESEMRALVAKCEQDCNEDVADVRKQLQSQEIEAEKVLEQAKESHRTELAAVVAKRERDVLAIAEKSREEVAAIRLLMDSQRTEGETELEKAIASFSAREEAQKSSHEMELLALKNELDAAVKKVIDELTSAHAAIIAELEKQMEMEALCELAQLAAAHDAKLAELTSKHDSHLFVVETEMDAMQMRHEAEILGLEADLLGAEEEAWHLDATISGLQIELKAQSEAALASLEHLRVEHAEEIARVRVTGVSSMDEAERMVAAMKSEMIVLQKKMAESERACELSLAEMQKEVGLTCVDMAAALAKISLLEQAREEDKVTAAQLSAEAEKRALEIVEASKKLAVLQSAHAEELHQLTTAKESEIRVLCERLATAEQSAKSDRAAWAEAAEVAEVRLAELAEKCSESAREMGELRVVITTMQEAAKIAADQAKAATSDPSLKLSKENFAAVLKERDALQRYAASLTIEINQFRRNHSVAELTLERKLQQVQSQFKCAREDFKRHEQEQRDQALLGRLDGDGKVTLLAEQRRHAEREKQMQEEVDAIAKSYFLSFAISVKMNLSTRGKFVNVNVHELYDEAIKQEVSWRDYPEFCNKMMLM